jgi:AcrR family transcriptional regulator
MTIEERKEREKEEMRGLILDTASEIITAEGFDKLSIRKIASRIEYSPAIIYHYFQDKDEIVNHVMKKGYQKIINALSSIQVSADQPEKRLKELTRSYIAVAMQMPDEFQAVQLNKSPAILEYTSSLFEGASLKKPALAILVQCLKDIYKEKNLDDSVIELTAQIIAASTFGLIIRLILEKNIGEEQRQKLIEHYIKVVVDGMVLGKSINE